jgi:hypothetical protein
METAFSKASIVNKNISTYSEKKRTTLISTPACQPARPARINMAKKITTSQVQVFLYCNQLVCKDKFHRVQSQPSQKTTQSTELLKN